VIIAKAIDIARRAHDGQLRKYTDEPYIVHPFAVAGLVASVTNDNNILAAAILHDVVEDTMVTSEFIREEFGDCIAGMVSDLTDISVPSDGNRAIRKKIDLNHTALASYEAQTIKLADLIDNSKTITYYDPAFAKVYMEEKRQLLTVLKGGNYQLYCMAEKIVNDYFTTKDESLKKKVVSTRKLKFGG